MLYDSTHFLVCYRILELVQNKGFISLPILLHKERKQALLGWDTNLPKMPRTRNAKHECFTIVMLIMQPTCSSSRRMRGIWDRWMKGRVGWWHSRHPCCWWWTRNLGRSWPVPCTLTGWHHGVWWAWIYGTCRYYKTIILKKNSRLTKLKNTCKIYTILRHLQSFRIYFTSVLSGQMKKKQDRNLRVFCLCFSK